jgi:hypothetical protein
MEQVERRELLAGQAVPRLIEVAISSAAKGADPALNNYRSFDLQVTVPSGTRWTAADLRLNLTRGTVYNPSAGGNTPDQSQWSSHPQLQYDSYVTTNGFKDPTILLGRSTYPTTSQGDPIFNNKTIDVAWGDLNTATGTFTIARFTVTKDAAGTIIGRIVDDMNSNGLPFSSSFPLYAGGASITGYAYNDLNGNGSYNTGESFVANVLVYIDKNSNGHFDTGEANTRTASNGTYRFSKLPGGTYRVRAVLPSGNRLTDPTRLGGSWNVTVIYGANAAGKRFGMTNKVLLSGVVFNDANSNKLRDNGEAGLSGFKVYIDRNNNGVWDSNESYRLSDSDGVFTWTNLNAGTYVVRIVTRSGYQRTTQSGFTISRGPGGALTTLKFGEHKIS